MLVPEIGLTPQLLRRFRERLGMEPLVSHSGVAAGDRMATWAAAARGEADTAAVEAAVEPEEPISVEKARTRRTSKPGAEPNPYLPEK